MAPIPKRPSRQEMRPDEKGLQARKREPRDVLSTQETVPSSFIDSSGDRELKAEYSVQPPTSQPAFLYVDRGPGAGQLLEITEGMLIIGRASVSDLRLQHPSISRRHTQIRRVGEQFFLKDLGSQNGTFVNGLRIGTEVEIKPGDAIASGNAVVRLRGPLTKSEKLSHRAGQTSGAQKNKTPKANVSTAVVMRPPAAIFGVKPHAPPRGKNVAWKVATLGGIGGFGLAALIAFALVKIMSHDDTVVAVVSEAKVERAQIIDAAIKRGGGDIDKEQPTIEPEAPVIRANPQPKPPSVTVATPAAKSAPAARKPAVKTPVAAQPDKHGDEEPTKDAPKRAQILAPYEKGHAEDALELAHQAGDKELTDKLSRFINSYDAAYEAVKANNGAVAIANFQKALTLDEGLSSGWGKYGAEIRRQLSNIYVLIGLQFITDGDPEKARTAFQAALKHDPSNARAKRQLTKLTPEAPPPQNIDDAFEGDAPQTAKKPSPPKGSIDDAFGE